FLGSVTARLMRILSCPILVLRTIEELEKPHRQTIPFKRILVGCDFSRDSDAALQRSLNIAQEFESELHLVHVVESGEPASGDLNEAIREKLSSMVPEDVMNWCEGVKTSVLEGKPHAELIRYADIHEIDLIALGVRGQSMVESLFVGSTTDRVVRRAPCPVLSVNPGPREQQ
ncbi:MAG: universal stress protein, partial [Desulfobacterales bacterium]